LHAPEISRILALDSAFVHGIEFMQRNRAIAIAAKRQADNNRLMFMLALLLLPAALLLLISPW